MILCNKKDKDCKNCIYFILWEVTPSEDCIENFDKIVIKD